MLCPHKTPCPRSPACPIYLMPMTTHTMATLLPSMTTRRNPWFPGSPDRFSSKGVFRASWYLWKLVTVLFACGCRGACLRAPSQVPRSPPTCGWCLLLRAKVLSGWGACLLATPWPFGKEAVPFDGG